MYIEVCDSKLAPRFLTLADFFIPGSTDFLGNPIGFLHDISEGVTGLVSEGNIGGLIKNVAHGTANSTAKLTGSLSYGISKATVHERYDERRLMLRRRRGEKSKEHLMAGLKGLGFGVLGGLTSIGKSDAFIHIWNSALIFYTKGFTNLPYTFRSVSQRFFEILLKSNSCSMKKDKPK